MQSINYSEEFYQNTDRLLTGDIREKNSNAVGTHDPLARAFLFLASYIGIATEPVDEAQLIESKDKIDYLAGEQKIGTYGFFLEKDWMKTDIGSFLTFREDETPVVIIYKRGRYSEADPMTGQLRALSTDEANALGPRAYSLFPDIEKGRFGSFFAAVSRDAFGDMLLFVLFSLFCAVLSLVLPGMFAFMIDKVVVYGNIRDSSFYTVILLGCLTALFFIQVVVNRIRLRLQTRVQSKSFFSYIRNLMKLSSGSLRRISGKVTSLTIPFVDATEAFTGSVVSFFVYMTQCLFAMVSVCMYSKVLSHVFFTMVAISFILCVIMMVCRYMVRLKGRIYEENLNTMRMEIIDNNEAVKAYNAENIMYYRHSLGYNSYLGTNLFSDFMQLGGVFVTTMLSSFGVYFLVFGRLNMTEDYNIGFISAALSSVSLFCSYFGMMVNSLMDIADQLPMLKLMREVSSMPVEPDDDKGLDLDLKGSIEVSHINFTYDPELPMVIRDMSFTVSPGEYIGIVGSSGCGKSTLLRLLMGFETPDGGSISYDGIDLQGWSLHSLRSQFGVVLQDTAVITGKIADNIAGIRSAGQEEIEEAARKAAILDDIKAMPMQFNTIISGESENISGGQKQRILLARALLSNPKILFLDEATSALDNISQKRVLESLAAMNITRFVIAHRLSTVRECDRILVLDKGQIVESGSYDELMSMNGLFRRLVERDMAAV